MQPRSVAHHGSISTGSVFSKFITNDRFSRIMFWPKIAPNTSSVVVIRILPKHRMYQWQYCVRHLEFAAGFSTPKRRVHNLHTIATGSPQDGPIKFDRLDPRSQLSFGIVGL